MRKVSDQAGNDGEKQHGSLPAQGRRKGRSDFNLTNNADEYLRYKLDGFPLDTKARVHFLTQYTVQKRW